MTTTRKLLLAVGIAVGLAVVGYCALVAFWILAVSLG
jgi:hypothetical protein